MEALETKYIEQPDEATLIILLPRGSHPDYHKTIILLKSTTEHLSKESPNRCSNPLPGFSVVSSIEFRLHYDQGQHTRNYVHIYVCVYTCTHGRSKRSSRSNFHVRFQDCTCADDK